MRLSNLLLAMACTLVVAGVSQAAALSLSNNSNYNAGPLLANWSPHQNIFKGVSVNQWNDTNTAFKNNSTTYPSGIGICDAGASNPGYTEWWLDGRYTSFDATMFVDDRTANPLAWDQFKVIGDGAVIASSGFTGLNGGAVSLSGVDVTGVKMLRLQVNGDGWGGRPQTYNFFSTAQATGTPGGYYNDTLNGSVSTSVKASNSVTFTSASNQAGGVGTTPSVDTWLDTASSLKVGGNSVSGIGLTAPTNSGIGNVLWTLSTGNDYRLLTFDLAPDDRWTTGYNDGTMGLYINGLLVDSYGLSSGVAAKTYSYLLNSGGPTNTVEFRITTGGWGGATKPYIDIINAQFIAIPEPASLGLLNLGGLALLRRRRA